MKYFSLLAVTCAVIGAFLYARKPVTTATPKMVSELPLTVQSDPTMENVKSPQPPHTKTSFEVKTETIFESLPTIELINSQPGREFHHAPQELIDAAKPLGEVISAMKADKALVPQGKRFFKKCALKEGLLEQVRALCLRDLKDWSNSTDDTLSMTEFPTRLVNLANFLPATKY